MSAVLEIEPTLSCMENKHFTELKPELSPVCSFLTCRFATTVCLRSVHKCLQSQDRVSAGAADGCEPPCVCWDSDQSLNELMVRAGLIDLCQVAEEPPTCLKPMARPACWGSDHGRIPEGKMSQEGTR